MSESFDEDNSWKEFRQEIDRLAVNGNGTSRAADLLALAFSKLEWKKCQNFFKLVTPAYFRYKTKIVPGVVYGSNYSGVLSIRQYNNS